MSDGAQVQPLDISDFSGGITENWFDSGSTRYRAADNFYITVDKKLAERQGTIPFDPLNYLLPGQPCRVDALFTYINESRLLVNQGRRISVLPENYAGWGSGVVGWTPVTGPSGNEALGAGQAYAQTVMGEFNHQMYFTNDSKPIPSRLYRDENNIYQVRTAGLPRVQNQPYYVVPPPPTLNPTGVITYGNLFQKCITNANSLRTAWINHINDQAASASFWTTNVTSQHALTDKYSLSYLTSVTFTPIADPEWPGPNPYPIPAPAASDLASLMALTTALNLSYTHHATSDTSYANYHWTIIRPAPGKAYGTAGSGSTVLIPGPRAPLANNTSVSTDGSSSGNNLALVTIATMLDDLFQKMYWHLYGVFTHGGAFNDVTLMQRNDFILPGNNGLLPITKIGPIGYNAATDTIPLQSPTIIANDQDFLDYVNGLQALWNSHCLGGGNTQLFTGLPNTPSPWPFLFPNTSLLHIQPDNENINTLYAATTLDQAFLSIFWMRFMYAQYHMPDMNGTYGTFTFNSTAGSNVITASLSGAFPLNINLFCTMGTPIFTAATGFKNVAVLTSQSGTSLTLDRTVIANNTAKPVSYCTNSFNRYHTFYNPAGLIAAGSHTATSGQLLTTLPAQISTDIVGWNSAAREFMYCLFNHISDQNAHQQTAGPANLVYFDPVNTPGVSQWFIPPDTMPSISFGFTYYDKWTVDPNGLIYSNESNPVYSNPVYSIEPYLVGTYAPVPVPAQPFLSSTNFHINVQRSIGISNIPGIVNDSSTNYNTSGIQVKVYRTAANGNTYYLIKTLPNGTDSFLDTQNSVTTPTNQTNLTTNPTLYTSGGIVGNDQPPKSKCLHIINGISYYGNITQSGQNLPNTILQGLAGNPDSAPATFLDSFEDEVVGISSARSNVIVFCKNSVYREAGGFNQLGQGQLTHEKISDSIGCLSVHSIVRTEIGVFFAGNDGFYWTDSFQLIKISIDLNKTFKNLTRTQAQKNRITGTYDKTTRRIWWSVQTQPSSQDCDMNYIYYLDYGVKPDGVFTTVSNSGSLVPLSSNVSNSPSVGNPLNYNYWQPSSMVFFKGELVRGDPRGVLFKTDSSATTDPKIDLTIPAFTFSGGVPTQNWGTVPIPFNYTSCSLNLGSHWERKYSTKVNWLGNNVGNAQVQISAISDNGRVVGNMAPINYTQNLLWGDARITWGATSSPNVNWYYGGDADFWRRFPTDTVRSNLRAIQLKNAFMGVYRSQDFPPGTSASANATTKVVTLNTPTYPATFFGTIIWPLDIVDYYLSFSDDMYHQTWQISQVSGNTLTVLDSSATLTTKTNLPWVIRGYKKNMSMEISGLVIRFAPFGDQTTYWNAPSDSGENNP